MRERYPLVKVQILSFIHFAHAAGSDEPKDLKAACQLCIGLEKVGAARDLILNASWLDLKRGGNVVKRKQAFHLFAQILVVAAGFV